jgi:plasmid stabilization system protein ParE
MNVEFAPRATRDLQEIGLYYRTVAGEATAMAVARRVEHVINLVARQPMIAPLISRRDNVRVALILRYPRARGYCSDIARSAHCPPPLGARNIARPAPGQLTCRAVLLAKR